MEPVDTLFFVNVLSVTSDEGAVYIIHKNNQHFLSILDPRLMKVISTIQLSFDVNYIVPPVVDRDSVFIASSVGDIVVLDKFSGDIVSKIDIGIMPVISALEQVGNSLLAICGVLISNGLKTDTDSFCLVSCSKTTGKKEFQTRSMKGLVRPMGFSPADVWISVDRNLFGFDLNGEQIGHLPIGFQPSYSPIVTDSHVVAANKAGLLEIFDKNGTSRIIMASPNQCKPVLFGDSLIWITDNGCWKISLIGDVSVVESISKNVKLTPIVDGKFIYYISEGVLHKLGKDDVSEPMKITDKLITHFSICDGYVLVIATDEIFRIKI